VTAVNSAIEALNMLPGVNLPTLSPQLEEVSQLAQNVVDAIDDLRSNIADFKAGVVQDVLAAFSARVEPIATLLANLEQLVDTSLARIDNLQAGVENLQAKLAKTIDLITVVSTIVLSWLILAQVSLFLAAGITQSRAGCCGAILTRHRLTQRWNRKRSSLQSEGWLPGKGLTPAGSFFVFVWERSISCWCSEPRLSTFMRVMMAPSRKIWEK
jgi:hypothetical protein